MNLLIQKFVKLESQVNRIANVSKVNINLLKRLKIKFLSIEI